MAGYIELYIDQGTTFNNIINVNDDVTNANVNVAGYVVTSQMRKSYYSQNASANIVCTITDAPNGQVTMSMTAGNTANIPAGRYLFVVIAINTSNATERLLEGIITITPRVTR